MKARVNNINHSNYLLKTVDDDILIQRKHSTDPFHIPHGFYHDYITTLIIRDRAYNVQLFQQSYRVRETTGELSIVY